MNSFLPSKLESSNKLAKVTILQNVSQPSAHSEYVLWDIRTVGAWYWYTKLSSALCVKQVVECMLLLMFGESGDKVDTVLQVVSGSLVLLWNGSNAFNQKTSAANR